MQPKKHILCVDDDPDTCYMLMHLLGREGYELRTVSTATEALALARSEHFDLYLLDNRLPDKDGITLCRALRALDSNHPVVFYSGAAYPTDHELATAAGATAYVNKPAIEQLLATLKDILG